jgi:hypothetical protein
VPSSEEDEGAVGSVGDTAGADQTSPEDHEPAEDGAAEEEGSEGEEEAWLVAMEKGQLDKTGYVPRRPGTSLTTRQVPLVSLLTSSSSFFDVSHLFWALKSSGETVYHLAVFSRKQCWDLQMSSCWNFHWGRPGRK